MEIDKNRKSYMPDVCPEEYHVKYWDLTNRICGKCEADKRDAEYKTELLAASRLERVSRLFEKAWLRNPYPIAASREPDDLWEAAERIVDFQIKKEGGK